MPVIAVFVSLALHPAMFLAMLLGILRIVCLVMRNIDIVVPSLFYEIDGVVAGIVFAAVRAPVLRMTGRYVQIDRLISDTDGRGPNHDGSRVNELGLGKTPDVNAAVKAGLGDTD
jgi:hypothetical protein